MFTRDYDWILASASGVLLAISFPKFGHPAFGWIALAPLLVALVSGSLSRAFVLGLTAGVIYFAGTLYWVARVMLVYGGFEAWAGTMLAYVMAALVNAALIAYLALFPALFAVLVRRLVWSYGATALVAAPLVWVATELGRTHLFTGFPWVLLGYSQVRVLPVAQLASVFGVYGVSALVAGVSAALAIAVVRGPSAGRFVPAAAMFAIVVGVAAWGSVRAAGAALTRTGQPIRVGLVQGNVDQAEKESPARSAAIFQEYLGMTRQAIGRGADLVLWPESSTTFYFEEDPIAAGRIRAIAREARVSILVGSDQIERGAPTRYYNSAFLVGENGATGGVYRKIHLVPFGEYVPLKRVFFFAAPLVEAVSDFSAGSESSLLPVRGHYISTAICYEIVYPDLVRRFVLAGSELLTTITNDAWFGPTSAPYQHFEQASMRAIEEGRYLVRSANTGISGIVDPYGRVLERSDIYQQTVLVGTARFLDARTIYSRTGDVFAYAAVVATAVLLVGGRRRVQ